MLKELVFEKLWRQMTTRGDVPSLQYSADTIVRSLQNEQASTAELTSLVLSDLALSQKVIRLANSAMYATLGGEVTTVSRAIMVLGVETVEHLSLGLQLLNQFESCAGAREDARAALKRALLAAEFTRRMTNSRGGHQCEEAVVCAMLHQLARLLVILYFENEWERIQALVTAEPDLSESQACHRLLGITFEELAQQAAERWNLPPAISRSMHCHLPDQDAVLNTHEEWLGGVASVSAGVAALVDANASEEEVLAFAKQYVDVLALNEGALQDAIELMRDSSSAIDQIDEPASANVQDVSQDMPKDAGKRLRDALTEVRDAAPELAPTAVTPWVVECMMNALNLKAGFMMLLNPATGSYTARFGFGPGVRERLSSLGFGGGFVPDVFHLVATKGTPAYFNDLQDKGVRHRVPDWYAAAFPETRSMVLVPVRLRNRCIAIFCGSWGDARCENNMTEMELSVLHELGGEVSRSFERAAAVSAPGRLGAE